MFCVSHIKIENLANHIKKKAKNIKMLNLLVKTESYGFEFLCLIFFM